MTWWSVPEGEVSARATAVVVGAGAGGAFAALTLAEAGVDVLVLEDGHALLPQSLDVGQAIGRYYAEGGYRTSSGSPPLPVAGGRALGGSTVINSALCFRTPPAVLDEWNALSGDALSDTTAFYRTQDAVEAVLRVAPTPDALLSGNDCAQREAARNLGWSEANIRRNTPTCAGCFQCNTGCPIGGKFSVDRELLPRAAAAGARVFAGCRVERVASGRVEGVVRGPDGEHRGRFSATGDAVVLAAGAISTPRLLLDSGLADTDGEVGRGLHLQPVISALGYIPERTIHRPGATQGHYIDEFAGDDIIIESNPVVASMLAAMPFYGAELQLMLSNAFRWANTGMLIRDRTRGRVLPTRRSKAVIHYALVEEDRLRLGRALQRGARLWFEGLGAERVVLGMFGSSALMHDMDEVCRRTEAMSVERPILYSSHPQCTCGLGRVTDEKGQVLEVPGVYCMDASVLPSNVGRNPQISVMTVARILAERLAEDLGGTVAPLQG